MYANSLNYFLMKFVNWERTLTLAWPIILPFGDINN